MRHTRITILPERRTDLKEPVLPERMEAPRVKRTTKGIEIKLYWRT